MWDLVSGLGAEDSLSWGQECIEQGLNEDVDADLLKDSQVVKLSGAAYTAVETFLTTGANKELGPLHVQLRGEMERARGEDGTVEWVSLEGLPGWLAKHRLLTGPSSSCSASAIVDGSVLVPSSIPFLSSPAVPPIGASDGDTNVPSLERWLTDALGPISGEYLAHCVAAFKAVYITTATELLEIPPSEITHNELKSMGIVKLGVRNRILKKFKQDTSLPISPVPPHPSNS